MGRKENVLLEQAVGKTICRNTVAITATAIL
jgi:hypothetical protein